MSATIRALTAILLMIGFYVLALGFAAGIVWFIYDDWQSGNYDPRALIGLPILLGFLLWSIVPRPDRFQPPGPRIDAADEPELFRELSSIAKSVGQELPHEVYLMPQVNAWVAQRGGIMGIGSRQVMALGLPLMALLTVSEFRAVLAHEFGHYQGGDTELGPWIYKTRAAIGRTVYHLGGSWMFIPFRWYGKLFLNVTLRISRGQEYAADRLAAQVAGRDAVVNGLKQIHRGGGVWDGYFSNELVPVMYRGFSPPVSAGLARFLQSPQIKGRVEESLNKELAEGKADPMNTHPALRERIAALQNISIRANEDGRPATALLVDFEKSDTTLFNNVAAALGNTKVKPLQPLKWEQAFSAVYVPNWKEEAACQQAAFRGLTISDLPEQFSSRALVKKIKNPEGLKGTEPERVDVTRNAVGCALCLVLLRQGWTFHTLPGEMYCEKNGMKLEPFAMVERLDQRRITAEQWKEMCTRAGILNLPLLTEAAQAAATAANSKATTSSPGQTNG